MCIKATVVATEHTRSNDYNIGLVLRFHSKEDEEAMLQWNRKDGPPLVIAKISEQYYTVAEINELRQQVLLAICLA